MDDLDRKILSLLAKNARMPVKEIAEQVSLTSPAVSSRIHKLETDGIISGYTVTLNRPADRVYVDALISLSVAPSKQDAFGEDHIVFVFLVGAGIVEDLGIILRGGGVGLAAGGAAHKGKQGQPCQQGGDESFHSRVVLSYPVLRVAELRRSARLVCAVLRLVYHIRTRRAEDCRKMVTVL